VSRLGATAEVLGEERLDGSVEPQRVGGARAGGSAHIAGLLSKSDCHSRRREPTVNGERYGVNCAVAASANAAGIPFRKGARVAS